MSSAHFPTIPETTFLKTFDKLPFLLMYYLNRNFDFLPVVPQMLWSEGHPVNLAFSAFLFTFLLGVWLFA